MTKIRKPDPAAEVAANRAMAQSSRQQGRAYPSPEVVVTQEYPVPQSEAQEQIPGPSPPPSPIQIPSVQSQRPQSQIQMTSPVSYVTREPKNSTEPPPVPPKIVEVMPNQRVQNSQSMVHTGPPPREPCVLLLGATGVGKSSFVSVSLGISQVEVGHGLDSCTSSWRDWPGQLRDGTRITLVDTPGFNDTKRDDMDILKDIESRILSDHLITGVLYLHRITDNRMSGSSRKNLELMRAVCGTRFFPRIVIATTMWNRVPEDRMGQMEEREHQLRSFWKDILDGRGHYERFDGTPASGESILQLFEPLAPGGSRPMLQLEHERLSGRALVDTAAGRIIQEEKLKRERQLLQQAEDLRQEEIERELDAHRKQSRKRGSKNASRGGSQSIRDAWTEFWRGEGGKY